MPHLPPAWTPLFAAGVSQRLGSCSADGTPAICRALAADVLPDGRILFLTARNASHELLAAVAQTGQAAAVLALPSTHRTLHIKGRDAVVAPAVAGDEQLLAARRDAFAAELLPFGFAHGFVLQHWYAVGAGELARVVFSLYGAWNQSPGPGAGQAIELLP